MSLQTEFIDALKVFTHLQQQERLDNLIQYLTKLNINESLENYWYIFWLGMLLYQEIPEIRNHKQNELLKKRLNQYLVHLNESYTSSAKLAKKYKI